MCEVLVINTPMGVSKSSTDNDDGLPPLGLGYIATNLKDHNIKVELLDAYDKNLGCDEIINIIALKKPKYVAMNIFSSNYTIVKSIVELCDQKADIIIGGQVCKFVYKQIINWKTSNDIKIVIGEGEHILVDLVKNALKEKAIKSSENRSVYCVDSNSIYFPSNISTIIIDRAFFLNEPVINYWGLKEASIITSRGCIYNCAFCGAARSINNQSNIREMTFSQMRKEMQSVLKAHPELEAIRILDDLFLKGKSKIDEAVLLFNEFKLKWRAMAHILSFNEVERVLLSRLEECGCKELFIGIESGSPRLLNKLHKTSDVRLIKETIHRIIESGINVKGYFIFGFPEEDEEDFIKTYELASELTGYRTDKAIFRTSVFQFRPYHGTELFNYIKDKRDFNQQIKPNEFLTNEIGRANLNFCADNYTKCSSELLHDFIIRTNALNSRM